MNRDEALGAIARLMGAWPGQEWSDITVEMWLEDLEQFTELEAQAAIRECRRELDWCPTWHQFRDAAMSARRVAGRTITQHTARVVVGRETQLANLARLRETYAAMTARVDQHDHHGPQPCPVCGGIAPTTSKRHIVHPQRNESA